MNSIFKINISSEFKLATRPNGEEARLFLLKTLEQYPEIEIDFSGAEPTPSFADECLGILCRTIGWEQFKHRVHIINVSEESKPLIKHVIMRRRSQSIPSILASN